MTISEFGYQEAKSNEAFDGVSMNI